MDWGGCLAPGHGRRAQESSLADREPGGMLSDPMRSADSGSQLVTEQMSCNNYLPLPATALRRPADAVRPVTDTQAFSSALAFGSPLAFRSAGETL
jgi:hypothetical protein